MAAPRSTHILGAFGARYMQAAHHARAVAATASSCPTNEQEIDRSVHHWALLKKRSNPALLQRISGDVLTEIVGLAPLERTANMAKTEASRR